MRVDCVYQELVHHFVCISFMNARDSPVGVIDACYPQGVQKRAKKEEMGEGGAERK